MNSTVTGIADNEDVDYYVIDAKKGERISAEVEGLRLGISEFDPYVAILNAKRFELGSSDDAALVWRDGFTSVIAPEDGKYIIQVRESAYAGNGACIYRLHVGNFPRATRLDARRAASLARPWRSAGSATRPAMRPPRSNFRPRWKKSLACSIRTPRGFRPIPTAFGSRRSIT